MNKISAEYMQLNKSIKKKSINDTKKYNALQKPTKTRLTFTY